MARMTDEQVFEHVGLTRDQIVALVTGMALPPKVVEIPHTKERPNCLICGKRINAANCQPIRYKS